MICSNCGQQNPDVAKFCMDCGSALPARTEEQPQPTPVQIPHPPTFQERQQDDRQAESQQPEYRQAPTQQGSAVKKKTIIIVVVVIAAILLLCCILTTVFAVVPAIKSVAQMAGITTKEDVAALLTGEGDSTGSDSSSSSGGGSSSTAGSTVSMQDIKGDYDTWFVFATADETDPTIACAMTIEATSGTHGTVILTPYEVIKHGDYADVTEFGTFTRPCTIDGSTLVFNVDFFGTGRNVPFEFALENDGSGGWSGNFSDADARSSGFLEVHGYMSPYGK